MDRAGDGGNDRDDSSDFDGEQVGVVDGGGGDSERVMNLSRCEIEFILGESPEGKVGGGEVGELELGSPGERQRYMSATAARVWQDGAGYSPCSDAMRCMLVNELGSGVVEACWRARRRAEGEAVTTGSEVHSSPSS